MKPIASLAVHTSMTVSPITISITPDCTTYMHDPASPLLNTTPPAGKLIFAPALRANRRMSISLPLILSPLLTVACCALCRTEEIGRDLRTAATLLCWRRQASLPPERTRATGMRSLQLLIRAAAGAGALAVFSAGACGAQEWPSKPVKIVVPFSPGGSSDQLARLLAPELSAAFKQQFIIENRAGSSGAVGSAQVARS